MIDSLSIPCDELLDKLDQEFQKAILSAKHPWHLANIATISLDGTPNSRMMVVRSHDLSKKLITSNTDIRSPKAQEILAFPKASLLFYDKEHKIQLRLKANAELNNQTLFAKSMWDSLKKYSQKCYTADFAPSSAKHQDDSHSQSGFSNFSVISLTYYEIDILLLHHLGHIRRKINFDLYGNISGDKFLNP
ncbi:MAG: pyridoxamine 5'-phosphate oxidase family protein [Alphaproteobacteria bacterium]|nr:pyridoxamine 5'-phosphate oxidase family protein [Alphaproteobacteria bacterium]OJV13910.1 MAG: hypothetical protein BGO27_08455 [Alphaproteobacteria bacterium 33-17]